MSALWVVVGQYRVRRAGDEGSGSAEEGASLSMCGEGIDAAGIDETKGNANPLEQE